MTRTPLSRRSALLALAALTPGCYGSFGLTKKVYGWNGSFSNIVVKELIFLAMLIIPVYGVVLFVDAFILNIIEFLTGSPVVSVKELGDGHRLAMEKMPDQRTARVVHTEHGRQVRVFLVRKTEDGGFELLDREERPLAVAAPTEAGGLELRDGKGAAVHQVSPRELDRLALAAEDRPLSSLVNDALREPGASRRVAALRASSSF